MGNTDIFEAMAHGYDTPERIRIAKIASDAIREFIEDGQRKIAIDFGCGTGLVGLNLIDAFSSIVFVDTSRNMLDRIDRKTADANIRHARTLCLDLETGLASDLRADYIFMAQVLLHIKEVEPVLTRLFEVLNPGGHLLIVDFDKNDNVKSDLVHPGFDQDDLIGLMTKIGYRDAASKNIYTGSKIFMNQDATMFIADARK
ncbi:class I SAM-dependent DNA methyltransferase [Paenibacillus sacheonensis]|uniref:Methyltransferase domain-containing protein n=1 Tax=Paenibacillus sacheonensis TaxID=742054 RepID=A0A7X4YJU6_9BACL|nr:class I SAM-dependent methyltransferase [Paenibacillus sacheonensis]MBM7564050.1 putative TPR repeat methyltransferase [Paenibacillus sacheonensis]NBC67618.1 methyltransferase domain-containing protein [Paenibacillus sacheonensis]